MPIPRAKSTEKTYPLGVITSAIANAHLDGILWLCDNVLLPGRWNIVFRSSTLPQTHLEAYTPPERYLRCCTAPW